MHWNWACVMRAPSRFRVDQEEDPQFELTETIIGVGHGNLVHPSALHWYRRRCRWVEFCSFALFFLNVERCVLCLRCVKVGWSHARCRSVSESVPSSVALTASNLVASWFPFLNVIAIYFSVYFFYSKREPARFWRMRSDIYVARKKWMKDDGCQLKMPEGASVI